MTEGTVHPAAVIDPKAKLAAGVEVGPFAVIGPEVTLGKNVKIHSHAIVTGHTDIGEGCEIHPFAVVGGPPQDMKYRGERSDLVVGSFTTIREHVTINGGTEGGGHITRVGSNCLILVGAHIAHDCQIGDHVLLVNNATLGGHVIVEDYAGLGGLCAVHQFVRIGAYSFTGGMSAVIQDLIPFGMALGNRAHLAGLNVVGLKRHGFQREQIHALRKAYGLLFADGGTLQERLDDVEKMFPGEAPVQRIVTFMRAKADRSFCTPRAGA
jgi:UDP-N-acetylglucosamine acyltransferase